MHPCQSLMLIWNGFDCLPVIQTQIFGWQQNELMADSNRSSMPYFCKTIQRLLQGT